jgi:hypothetical protein
MLTYRREEARSLLVDRPLALDSYLSSKIFILIFKNMPYSQEHVIFYLLLHLLQYDISGKPELICGVDVLLQLFFLFQQEFPF